MLCARTLRRRPATPQAMTDETQNPGSQDLAESPIPPLKPAKRPKPGPGRHGSGRITSSASAPAPTPSAIHSAAPKPIPASIASPAPAPTPNPSLAVAPAPATKPLAHPPSKPAPKRKAPAVKAPKLGPLGLEETISIGIALTVLRGPFFILQVETTGRHPDPDNEILAISAMRVDEGTLMAEFSVQVGEHGVSVQKAVTMLCAFLGNHRRHVFAHGAEAIQALLGPAARQYGLQIENPTFGENSGCPW